MNVLHKGDGVFVLSKLPTRDCVSDINVCCDRSCVVNVLLCQCGVAVMQLSVVCDSQSVMSLCLATDVVCVATDAEDCIDVVV